MIEKRVQPHDAFDQIRAQSNAWTSAFNASNLEAILALYAPDAVVIPPQQERLVGRKDIETFVRSYLQVVASEQSTETVTLENMGRASLQTGSYRSTVHANASGPVADEGSFLRIWKPSSKGTMLIYHEMFNSDLQQSG